MQSIPTSSRPFQLRRHPRPASAALLALALVLLARGAVPLGAQGTPPAGPSLHGLEWRNIGPFRGGRVTTVTGVPGDPLTYYMGGAGGGVWKTTDAGLAWTNISDGFFKTGSVGAIAVAESDHNVIYVGMGEAPVRGVATSHGDGVYKSTDGGRTWTHVGLEATRHISMIHVHPKNPDLVYVAAQGSPWGPNPERGVYRSSDGGKTWAQVHKVDTTTGVSDLSMDYTNPRVLYAAYWDHQRLPWTVRSGGPGSSLYKTTDGGDTWTKLTEGLPAGAWGKVAVSVSRANPDRVWTLIEADEGGLFRSDDAGKTFRKVNDERVLRTRAWYYINVFADPQNADTVWVLNAPAMRSIDGGRTFEDMHTPHGDNHGLWINPANNQWVINSNDGGATISLNGGRTWSTQGNQPTAQFYRVNADARFPYWVYGGQQDNTSVAIASRTSGAGIDVPDWHPVSGCESAYLAFNPKDPSLVYGGCYQGIIQEWNAATDTSRNVMEYASLGLAEPSNEQKYRFNWNAPIVVSMHDPSVIYHGGNVLFRSRTRGRSWEAMSGDLTRNERDHQGNGGGPFTNEGAGGEVYGTIFYIEESPLDAATLWVGSDDGLVHVTRDGGKTWTNVTPKGLPDWQINAIEASPHDRDTAYVAVTGYKRNDFTPNVYRTTDGGKTWTKTVAGIPNTTFVRVVREDPVRKGLLYAGTETGLYLSFDAGASWRPFQSNLPIVPINDLMVHGNDLIAATQGRAFWILDDVTPLRAIEPNATVTRLFRPADALRAPGANPAIPGVGRNAPAGAIVYFSVDKAPDEKTPLTLEFLGQGGAVLRKVSSVEPPAPRPGQPAGPRPTRLSAKPGLNRFVWDLRREPVASIPGQFVNGGLEGARVPPGTYQVRLTFGATTQTEPLVLVGDPREKIADADFRTADDMLTTMARRVDTIHKAVVQLRDVREQVNAVVERARGGAAADAVSNAGKALAEKLTAWEEAVITPRQKTFQDVINFRNRLNAHYLYLIAEIDESGPPVTDGMRARYADLEKEWATREAEWKALLEKDLPAFNTLLRDSSVAAVSVKP